MNFAYGTELNIEFQQVKNTLYSAHKEFTLFASSVDLLRSFQKKKKVKAHCGQ